MYPHGLNRAGVVYLLHLIALGNGADDHGGDGSEQADDGDDRTDHAAAGDGGNAFARREGGVHGLDGCDCLVDHGDQADYARGDDGNDEVPAAQGVGACGDDLHEPCHALIELLHPLGIEQGVELLHGGGQPVLGGGDGFLPYRVLLRGGARCTHGTGVQLIGTAATLHALGHVRHQGNEVVLLAGTRHRGGNIGLLLAGESVPLGGDVGEDIRHIPPVAFIVHECHVDGAQGLGDVVDLGGILYVEPLLLDGVQSGHDGVDGRADDLWCLPCLLTDGGNIRAQPLKGQAELLRGGGGLLHGAADLIRAGSTHVAQVGEYIRDVLGADAHGVGGGGDDLGRVLELHGGDLCVLGGGDQTLVDLLLIQALPPEFGGSYRDFRGGDFHVPGEVPVTVAQLVGLFLGPASDDTDLIQLVVVGLGKGDGIAPERGLPTKQQHGGCHLQQSAGDAPQRVLQGGSVVLHTAHAAPLGGFRVAGLGDEVEDFLADVLFDGQGTDLLLDAADLLERLLCALAPVGLARFVAALDGEVVLAVGIGQLLVGRLHLLELLGTGALGVVLRGGAILLGS